MSNMLVPLRKTAAEEKLIMQDYERCSRFAAHYFGSVAAAITLESEFGSGLGPSATSARAKNAQGENIPLRKLSSLELKEFKADLLDLPAFLMLGRWMTILPTISTPEPTS